MNSSIKTPSEAHDISDIGKISKISDTSNVDHGDESATENYFPTSDHGSDDHKLSGVKLPVLGFALCLMVFLIALNGTVVATAVPQITNQFNSLNDVGWYGSATLLTNCAIGPLTGKIYTFSPLKGTFIIFLSVYMLANLISAVAVSSNMLIIGRCVQGIGGAGVMNGVFTIIAAAVPKDKKPIYLGFGIGISSIGAVIGPVVGGPLTQHASWRWCFYINLPPVGLTILLLLFLRIPEQTTKKPISQNIMPLLRELDIGGFVLFAPACIMFLLAVNWGGSSYPWKSATVVGLICGSIVTACLFAVWQRRRGDCAMIPPTIIGNRLVLFGCLVSGFQMGALSLVAYYLPLWFQIVKDASPTKSGVMTLPSAITQALGSFVAAKVVQIIRRCTPWAIFGSLLSSIGAGLMSTFRPETGAGRWIGFQILIGTGRGSVMQMPLTAIQSFLPGNHVAIATSLIFFFQNFGGALFLSLAQTIMDNSLPPALEKYAPDADAQAIISAGATGFRSLTDKSDLPGVVLAFNSAITNTYYLAAGGSCAAFIACFGMGWRKIERSQDNK